MENIYKINNNKFKSIYISYNFTFMIKKEEIPKNIITSLILSKGTTKFNSVKKIEEHLANLYGTNFDVNFEKIGDFFNIEFRVEAINKKFLPNNEDVVKSAVDFLYEVIYNPIINASKVDIDIFEREKELVIDKINKRKDKKLSYAVIKTEELLCQNEPFGIYLYGEIKDAKKVSSKDIYETYLKIIQDSDISIIISGNLEGYEDIEKYITKVFEIKTNRTKRIKKSIENSVIYPVLTDEIQEIRENMVTTQSVITIGMKVENLEKDDFYALNVYNTILGGTPSSKLFQTVREKESLAYVTRSRYYRFKGIFVIYAGIEEDKYETAKKVIIKQIEDIKEGNITNLELETAVQSLINDLTEWKDSKISLAKLAYTNAILGEELSIEDLIRNMKNIKIEDVIEIAQKIKPKLIYLLGGEEHEK